MVYFANATLRFDGSCQPNPGAGGGGYVIFNDNNMNTIIEGRYYVGDDCTNNVAEYFGLIAGLKRLRSSPHNIGHLSIEGDSQLVINHLNYRNNVNSNRLRPLVFEVRNLIRSCEGRDFNSHSFAHIDRSMNERADGLARDAVLSLTGQVIFTRELGI
jgi:ribonuclease HI